MDKSEATLGELEEPRRRSGFSLRDLKTFDSFSNPYYRFYYCAVSGQWASMSMQSVTQSLLIYRLTGSGVVLGSLALAQALPLFFFSFLGGVLADRVPKKFVMTAGQTLAGLNALVVTLALVSGFLSKDNAGSWLILVVTSAVQGMIMGIYYPSSQSMIREIVAPGQTMNAVSLGNMGQNAFQLLGPAVAGFLIDGFGFHTVYMLMSSVYFFGAIAATFLPRNIPSSTGQRHPLRDMTDGFAYVKRQPHLFQVLLFALLTSLFGMPFIMLLPMFTENILKVGANGLGILAGISGLGALAGSLVFASLPSKKGGKIFLTMGMALGIVVMIFSSSRGWYLCLAMAILYGLARTGKITLENSLLQRYSDSAYRGRVLSLQTMQMSFTSFGTFASGVMAEAVGVQWALASLGGTLLVISLTMWKLASQLRNLQ